MDTQVYELSNKQVKRLYKTCASKILPGYCIAINITLPPVGDVYAPVIVKDAIGQVLGSITVKEAWAL